MNNVLAVRAAVKSFPSGVRRLEVLRGADLSVAAGETVSIRGESGSGKTTLLNVIAGLESLDQGAVQWEDKDVSGWSRSAMARERARFLGMVFQAYYLIPELNVLENVFLPARILGTAGKEARARAGRLLGRVGLGGRPDENPAKLSGGERQRVALARALINCPRLVLADEPTGNLDEKTAGAVMDLLWEVCEEEQAALILVTHNANFAARAGRRLFLHLGVLRDAGGSPARTSGGASGP